MHLSISEHSLIYVLRKAYYVQTDTKTIAVRFMKNFNADNFVNDLNQQPWVDVCHNAADSNKIWQILRSLFMEIIDKHAPIRAK